MKKHEYKLHVCVLGRIRLIEDLNALGALGWECFQIEYENIGILEKHTAFLKREITG